MVVPSVEGLRGHLVAFLAGVEGTSGVLDLVAGRYGVDLGSAEGVRKAGLDPETPLVGYVSGDAIVVATGVADDERFVALVADRIRRGAGGTLDPGDEEANPRTARGPLIDAPKPAPGEDTATPSEDAATPVPAWRAAWGVTKDRVAVVVVTTGAADPAAAWHAAAKGDGGYVDSAAAKAARETAGEGAVLWGSASGFGPKAPGGLGLLRSAIAAPIEGLRHWRGGLVVAEDRLTLRVSVAEDEEDGADIPISWLSPDGPADAFADVYPKTTTVFLRGRFDVARVRKIPSFLRSRFVPATIPGAGGLPLPGVNDLLEVVEGDFALGILGVEPDVTIQHLLSIRRGGLGLANLARVFHVAVGVRLRDVEKAKGLYEGIAAQLRTSSGWTVAPMSGGGFTGWAFHRKAEAYNVLIGHGVMLFITGRGEVEPFVAVGEERALPLSAAAEGEPVAAAALGMAPKPSAGEAAPAQLGVVLGFTRVTRELADKGVPPYFLKIMNDIRVLAVAVRVAEREVTLSLEVAL